MIKPILDAVGSICPCNRTKCAFPNGWPKASLCLLRPDHAFNYVSNLCMQRNRELVAEIWLNCHLHSWINNCKIKLLSPPHFIVWEICSYRWQKLCQCYPAIRAWSWSSNLAVVWMHTSKTTSYILELKLPSLFCQRLPYSSQQQWIQIANIVLQPNKKISVYSFILALPGVPRSLSEWRWWICSLGPAIYSVFFFSFFSSQPFIWCVIYINCFMFCFCVFMSALVDCFILLLLFFLIFIFMICFYFVVLIFKFQLV